MIARLCRLTTTVLLASLSLVALPRDTNKEAFIRTYLASQGLPHLVIQVYVDTELDACSTAKVRGSIGIITIDPDCVKSIQPFRGETLKASGLLGRPLGQKYSVWRYFLSSSSGDRKFRDIYDVWSLGVIGHELGHILNLHSRMSDATVKQRQMEAEEYAGYFLYQYGVTLSEAIAGYADKPVVQSPDTPTREEVGERVEEGWLTAEKAAAAALSSTPRSFYTKYVTQRDERLAAEAALEEARAEHARQQDHLRSALAVRTRQADQYGIALLVVFFLFVAAAGVAVHVSERLAELRKKKLAAPATAPPSPKKPAGNPAADQFFGDALFLLETIDAAIARTVSEFGIAWPSCADAFRRAPSLDAVDHAQRDLTCLREASKRYRAFQGALAIVRGDYEVLPGAFSSAAVEALDDADDILAKLTKDHLLQRQWDVYGEAMQRCLLWYWSLSPLEDALRELKLSRDSIDQRTVNQSRRSLARQAHPDVLKDGGTAMVRINAAADLLLDYLDRSTRRSAAA